MSKQKRGSPPPLPAAVRRSSALKRRVGGQARPERKRSGAVRAVPQPNNPLAVFQLQAKPSPNPPSLEPPSKRRLAMPGAHPPELPLVLPPPPRTVAVGDGTSDPAPEPAPRPATAAETRAGGDAAGLQRVRVSSERPTVPNVGTFAFDEAPTLIRDPETTASVGIAGETSSARPAAIELGVVAEPSEPAEPEPASPSDPRGSSLPRTRRRILLLIAGTGIAGLLVVGSVLHPELYQRRSWSARAATLPGKAPTEQAQHRATPAASPKQPAAAPAGTTPRPAARASGEHEAPRSGGSGVEGIPWSTKSAASASHCVPESGDSETRNDELARAQKLQVLAHRRLIQGDLEGSVEALCRAAALDRNDSTLAFRLAQALLMNRDGAAAAAWAKRALTSSPPDHRAHEYLADALAWQGKVEAARDEWFRIRKVAEKSDEMLDTMRRGALLEAKRAKKHGDLRQAERFLRRALVFDTENAKITTLIAGVVLEEGHADSAALWIQRALLLSDDDSQRRLLAGDIQRALGNVPAASIHFRRALELDPNNAAARLRAKQ